MPLPRSIPVAFPIVGATLTLLLAAVAPGGPLPVDSALAVTLVSRSAGLQTPEKEEGNTEYEVGDVNHDGHLDLVSVGDHGSPFFNSDQHGIMVWLGNGSGSWTVHQFSNFGYGGCALGDLDLDGQLDIAWGVHHNYGSGMAARLMGAATGDGSGQSWADWGLGLASSGEDWGMFATALADFDCNGRLDIISQSFGGGNGLRLYENHGDGTWSQAWALTGGSVGSTIEACDVNADGYPDIVSTRQGSIVLLGDGAFGFTPAVSGIPAGTIRGIEAGDMNGDGHDDLVFALGSTGLRCLAWDDAAYQWVNASNGLPATGTWDRTQFGDLDGDGHLDVVAYREPSGHVYLGDGNGNWTTDAGWTMASPGDVSALRVDGDIDHDGREDIVVQADMSGFPFYRNQLKVYSPWGEPAVLDARVAAPDGGEVLVNGSIRFVRWLAAIPAAHGAASVDLELSVNGTAGPWTALAGGLPNSGSFQWLVASPGASASCRVRATMTTALGSVSVMSAADFAIVAGTTAIQPAAAPFNPVRLTVRPNPVLSTAEFSVDGASREATLAIYDPLGRLIHSVRPSGTFTWVPGGAAPAGVYFAQLRGEAATQVIKFVVLP